MSSPLASSSFLAKVIDPHPIAVKPEMRLTEAIALMNSSTSARKSCILVQSAGKLVGIFSERDIVKLTARGASLTGVRVREIMSENLIVLRESDDCDLLSILNRFHRHRIRHLPVLNADGGPVGVVTQDSIRAYLQPTDLLKLRRVSEVMSSEVICTELATSVREIARLMDEHRISCVAIANSNGHPIGILTERDIVQLQILGVDFETTVAQAAMSTPLFCLHPDDSLLKAHQEMKRLRVRRLVVAGSEGELVGILTQTSLLRSLDPTEMYGVVQALQEKVSALKSVNNNLLQSRNRQLEAQVQERTARLQAQAQKDRLLADLAHQIRQSLDVREILNIAVAQVRQILKVERVLICCLETRWQATVTVESVSDSQWSMLGQRVGSVGPVWSASQQAGRIQAIEDLRKCSANPIYTRFLAQFQGRAHLVVPIWQGDRLWGFLLAHQCSQPRQWQQLEIEFLEQLATHLGIAVRQAELYQQAQTELRDRRQAEIALKQLNEELESRVERRTAQLKHLNEALQQEIIERQQVEATLQEQFTAVEAATDGIAILNRKGEYVYLNTAHLQLFGRDRASELLGKTWQTLYPPEEVQRFERDVFPQLQNKGYWQGEAIALRKDGSTFTEEVSLTLLDDERFICVCRDISDRKQAEAALRESQLLVERIAESTPNILYLYDLIEGRIAYVNRNVAGILGYTSSEFQSLGTGLFPALIHPQDTRQLLKQVQQFKQVKDGEVLEITYRIKHAQNGWRWLMSRHTVFNRTDRGQPKQILGTATDITHLKQTEEALRQANEKLRQQAIRDPLTGLFNRRYLEESLQREIHRADRLNATVGTIMLDIDRFKSFNDRFGHEAGDLVLRELGQFLQDHLRSSDIVCRYGGEEFTVILPDASLENTKARAEQLRQGIKQLQLDYQGQSLGQITLSLGVSCFPSSGRTQDELLRRADKALYQAKMAGRDRTVVFQSEQLSALNTLPGNSVERAADFTS